MPLGLNPELILAGRPPQIENPVDQMRKVADLRQVQAQNSLAPQRAALVQQQVDQGPLETRRMELQNQQLELSQRSQAAYAKAMQEANGDPDKMEAALKTAPLTPEHRAAVDNQIAQTRLRREGATQKQIEEDRKYQDQFATGLYSVYTASPEQQLPAWQALVDRVATTKDPLTGKPYALPSGIDRSTLPPPEAIKMIGRALSQKGWDTAETDAQKAKDAAATRSDVNSKRDQDAFQRGVALAAQLGGTAQNQDEWSAVREHFDPNDPDADTARINKRVLSMFPKQFTEANRKAVEQRGVSAEKRAAEAGRSQDKSISDTELQMKVTRGNQPNATPEEKQAGIEASQTLAAEQQRKVDVAKAGAAARQEAAAGGATEDDFRRAGEEYAITGVMPAIGRDSGGRNKVMHYKQEFARQSGLSPRDLVAAAAAFKGDTKSLESFQKQRDQIVSFEQTAQKNLDLFLDAASKIPDTGVPWLNSPLRDLDEKLVGSGNMSAVNAARQVANNEIAKVTSGGGLSGVLSDSARKEVGSYNPSNATFKQTLAVARVLKQDMANRHASMDTTLEEIRNRIGRPTAQPASTAAPASAVPVNSSPPNPYR